jgi:hypothetical protein
MALEELGAHCLLELPEAAEHGRVIHPELLGRGRQGSDLGDALDQAQVIPGEVLDRFCHD